MINLNRLEVVGNLTRDPELRYTPNGQAVASFAIATNRRYRDNSNNWVDSPPEYHEVVVWGKLGEGVQQILKKGMRVYAAGRVQTHSWDAPDGTKRYKTELIVDTIIGPDQVSKAAFASGAGTEGYSSQNRPVANQEPTTPDQSPKDPTPSVSNDEINIEDIPF